MSASMLVDTQYRQPVLFKPRHPASWVPDERAHTCFKCNATFVSVLCRRHHCRLWAGSFVVIAAMCLQSQHYILIWQTHQFVFAMIAMHTTKSAKY